MSMIGMPSVMQMISSMPASAASRMASAATGGGTKMTEALAPVALHRLRDGVEDRGSLRALVPPLPGVTPPTTAVPYSRICLAWKVPAEPVMP